jgi:hypothetical protein
MGGRYTTHPQPHEPLLVGWGIGEAIGGHHSPLQSTHDHCHEPLLMGGRGTMQEVVCAHWAGGWVLTAVLMNDGGEQMMVGMIHHPPLALQATACGVGHG